MSIQEPRQNDADALGALLRGAWRQRGVAAVAGGILFLLSAVTVFSLTPRYAAETLILLSSSSSPDLSDGRTARVTSATDPFVVRSEADILFSDAICDRVIEELKLAEQGEFKLAEGHLSSIRSWLGLAGRVGTTPDTDRTWTEEEARHEAVLRLYKDRLSVFNDGRSLTVRIGFSSENPRLASTVANAHARAYLDAQAQRRSGTQRDTLTWLKNELESGARELRTAEAAVQVFRADSGLVLLNRQAQQLSVTDQELMQLSEQLTAARGEAARTTSRLEQVGAKMENGLLFGTGEIMNSPVLAKLRERETDARAAFDRASSLYPENSPNVSTARIELRSIEGAFRRELERVHAGLRADHNAAMVRVRLLEEEVERAKHEKLRLDRAEAELRTREAFAAAKRSIYDALLGRYNVLLAEERFGGSDAQLVSKASIPTRAAYPKTALFLLSGLAASLIAGLGCAYLADRFRRPKVADRQGSRGEIPRVTVRAA